MVAQQIELSNTDVTLNRNKFIGGSEIAKIMGKSRWGSPFSVWAIKTGKIPAPDLSDIEAVRIGNKLEQFVADLFTEETGKAVRKAPKAYQHPLYPYMVAHIDRIVTGTDELLECKTTSQYKDREWVDNEIPQEYILQVQWYLGITGRKLGHIAVLIGGQHYKSKPIEFDAELFDIMVETAKDFWENYVLTDIPPKVSANDDDILAELFPTEENDVLIELYPTDERSEIATTEFENKIALIKELEADKTAIEKEIKQHKNDLKQVIGENLGIKTPKYLITYKTVNRIDIDTTRLKTEKPEIVKEYLKDSSYRRINISKNKDFEIS